MKKHSKMYVEALGNVDKTKNYDVTEAIKVLKSLKTRKFDESVDLVLSLNIDAKKTDMNVRGSFVLPNGTGKTKRVLVVTKTKAAEATEADYCGAEDMLEKIEKENWFDFDTIVATPEMMPALGKLSFSEAKLEENLRAIVAEIVKNKPSGVKGTFVKSISLSSTMSPGFKIDKASLGL